MRVRPPPPSETALDKGLLTDLLNAIVRDPERIDHEPLDPLERLVADRAVEGPALDAVMLDLLVDLAFYVANPIHRAHDPSYFGDDRLRAEIAQALSAIEALGLN